MTVELRHLRCFVAIAEEVFRDRAVTALAAVDDALDPSHAGTWPLRVGHAWSALGDYTTALVHGAGMAWWAS